MLAGDCPAGSFYIGGEILLEIAARAEHTWRIR
jgi:hypothetical protein